MYVHTCSVNWFALLPDTCIYMQMLVKAGADIAEKNEDEETVLHVAAENGRVE